VEIQNNFVIIYFNFFHISYLRFFLKIVKVHSSYSWIRRVISSSHLRFLHSTTGYININVYLIKPNYVTKYQILITKRDQKHFFEYFFNMFCINDLKNNNEMGIGVNGYLKSFISEIVVHIHYMYTCLTNLVIESQNKI